MNKLEKYTSYKDSGVEWIGEIPEHWTVKRVKILSRVKRGASPRPIDDPRYFDDNGEFAWVRIADVTANNHYLKNTVQKLSKLGASLSVKLQPNELFLSIAGSVGKPMISNIKCCIHDGFVYFPELKFNKEFLYRVFETGRPYVGLGKTGTQLNLNTDSVGGISIPIPPKDEIDAILYFINNKTSQIDNAISQKEKLIELLKEQKQITINEAVTKGLDKDVELKNSGVEWIGEIPKHWKVSKLGTCLKPISIKNRTELPLLSVTREQGVILRDVDNTDSNHNFIPDDLSPYKMVEKGQFAMNKMKAWQGSYGISDYTGIVSPAYYIFELNGIEPTFFHKAIRSSVYVPFFIKASDGVRIGQWDLSKSRMKEIPFYIPPTKEEQLQIVEYIEAQTSKIDKAINLQQNYITKLKEYKASLIDSVVTGKVRVV